MPVPQVPGPQVIGPQIVGQVPAGGIVIPPIPDRGLSRVSHRSHYVVPGELSESGHGPYIHHIPSSEGTYSSATSDDRSFQIPGHLPVHGTSTSAPVIPSHVDTSSSESVSTSAESTFESETVTGEESGPEVYPIVPGGSRPPSSYVGDGAIVIPLAPSLGTSVHAPSVAAPSVHAPSVFAPSVYAPSVHAPSVASLPCVPGSVASPRIPGSVTSPHRVPGSATSPHRYPGSPSPSCAISSPSSAPHVVGSPQAGVIVVQPPAPEEVVVVQPPASEASSSGAEPAVVEIVPPEVPPVEDAASQVIRVSSPAGSQPPAQVIRIVPGPQVIKPQIVGQVLAGGIVVPPIPDRGPPRVSHRSHYVVPGELSETAHGPYIHHASSSEGTYSSATSDDRSFQIPGHPPVPDRHRLLPP
ncbi:hypothetical protein FRC11_011024 [Ceratobasidium sp. 423]|nr:hypothetical protein FRC11_011024 [Ceratobasidium sp. 423]